MTGRPRGRPKSSTRDDVSIKFDRKLSGMARLIAKGRGVSMSQYLEEITRATIERDYARMMEEFQKGDLGT